MKEGSCRDEISSGAETANDHIITIQPDISGSVCQPGCWGKYKRKRAVKNLTALLYLEYDLFIAR